MAALPVPAPTLTALRELQLYGAVPMVSISLLMSLGMDYDKVSEVAKIWKQMARDLDRPVEVLDGIPNETRQRWIADDQREFSRVTGDMHTGTEALRDSLDKMGDMLESMSIAFRLFKGSMAALGAMLIPLTAYLVPMSMVPASAVQARMSLRWLANAADKIVVVMVGALITHFTGQMAIIAYLVAREHQLDKMADLHITDGGWAKGSLKGVDFSTVKIDRSAYPTFQFPDRGDKLPDGAKDFKWVAPAKPPAEPPAEPVQD
ncbi:hypothetical protein [Nonomuraea sp. NPDC049784]|uniref:WXG100 family type VII secretion target n=1 Tax=Nonomuraea sp. NPDC049784 TaxID=3154361 RepID=UPI0033C73E79